MTAIVQVSKLKVFIFILTFFFSSNLYAPDVVIEPSERNPLSAYFDGTRSLEGFEQIYFMRCVALQLDRKSVV